MGKLHTDLKLLKKSGKGAVNAALIIYFFKKIKRAEKKKGTHM